MPGVLLNLILPEDSDSVAVAIPKLKTCITTIQADLEPRVVPSEIDVNADWDLAGHDLVGAQSIQLEPAADVGDYPAGAAVYVDGDWYLITVDGAVRVTEAGQLSGTGERGFVGDYGVGGNPAAATYVNSAGVFQFTEEPGVWADLECDDIILHGSAAKTTIGVDSTLLADQTLQLSKVVPTAAERHLLVVDQNGLVTNTEDSQITGDIEFSSGADIVLVTPRQIKHSGVGYYTEPAREQPGSSVNWVTGGASVVGVTLASTSVQPFSYRFGQVQHGDRIDSITFGAQGGAAGDDLSSVNAYVHHLDGTVTNLNPSPTSYTNIGTSYVQRVVSIDPTDLIDGDTVFFGMVVNGTVPGVLMGPARLRKTRP